MYEIMLSNHAHPFMFATSKDKCEHHKEQNLFELKVIQNILHGIYHDNYNSDPASVIDVPQSQIQWKITGRYQHVNTFQSFYNNQLFSNVAPAEIRIVISNFTI